MFRSKAGSARCAGLLCDGRRGGRCEPAVSERLEQRVLLAGFAGIGFEVGQNGIDAIIVEGETSSSGLTSGSLFRSGASGRVADGAFGRVWIEQRPGGKLVLRPGDNTTPYDAELGASFFGSLGFPAGWFAGVDQTDPFGQFSFMVERPAAATAADLSGNWVWSTYQWNPTSGDASVLSGTLSASGNFMLWFATGLGVAPIARTTEITTVGEEGTFLTNRGEHLYLNATKDVLLTIDMRESDGDLSIGIAVRADTSVTTAEIAGGYRLGLGATPGATASFFQTGDARVGAIYLDLQANGNARLYGMADYDAGDLSNPSSGTWSLSGSTVTLVLGSSANVLRFSVADNGSSLVSYTPVSGTIAAARIIGLATRATPVGNPAIELVSYEAALVGAGNRPTFYELRSDGVWREIDLIATATGSSPQTTPGIEIITWTDTKDSLVYVATTTATGTYLYRRSASGTWTVRDLTAELSATAEPIVSGLTVFASAGAGPRLVTIAGLAGDGDLIMYRQTGTTSVVGYVYGYNDVADEFLRPIGREMPQFVGPLVSYVTPWNGQNIAGLNASGQIEVIWNSPAINGHWVLSNLSTITGAPAFNGGLTVYQTRWRGINIVGVDSAGTVITTWWVPQFAGFWATSNLTSVAIGGGPLLQGDSIVAFTTPDGGLNIAGRNGEGELELYWWVPNTDNKWKIRELTASQPESLERPVGRLQALVRPDGSISLFGRSADGDVVRSFWEPALPVDQWWLENVSTLSI